MMGYTKYIWFEGSKGSKMGDASGSVGSEIPGAGWEDDGNNLRWGFI